MKTKRNSSSIICGLTIALFGLAAATHAQPTVLSSGHVDIFEAEYELHDEVPEIHLGVHTDDGHFEPGNVLLQVKNGAYRSTDGLLVEITSILGPNAWILPSDIETAHDLGVIEAGVAKAGFPNTSAVTFTLVSAGASNPGNFVLFTSGNAIRLSAIGGDVGTASFGITAGHIHYNWGFSAAGTYIFDMQASYTDPAYGNLQSPVETYTFEVVPEPSTYALLALGAGALALMRWRKRSRQS
ncbi:MAG: choice-of-anchor M domain-containing protein [Akkermansiaceae bacterium]